MGLIENWLGELFFWGDTSAFAVHAGQDWVRRSAHPEKARRGRLALNYRVFESFIDIAAQE